MYPPCESLNQLFPFHLSLFHSHVHVPYPHSTASVSSIVSPFHPTMSPFHSVMSPFHSTMSPFHSSHTHVVADRGVGWEEACALAEQAKGKGSGFYRSQEGTVPPPPLPASLTEREYFTSVQHHQVGCHVTLMSCHST